jgi:hypothetical protein
MKRNVTITLDEETAGWVRAEAARRGVSVSQYLGDLLRERRQVAGGYEAARTRFMARDPRPLRAQGQPLPGRDELYERGSA